MKRGYLMRQDEILQVHHPRDRQPALDASGTRQSVGMPSRLELAHPEVEDAAQKDVHQQESKLETAPHDLRIVALSAADEFLLRLRFFASRRDNPHHLRDDFGMKLSRHGVSVLETA